MRGKRVSALNQIEDTVYEYVAVWNEYWAEHHDDYEENIEIVFFSDRLVDDEFVRMISDEMPLLLAVFLLMLIYLMFTLGTLSCSGARPWLALSAVIILLGALLIGFSIGLCCGTTFNAMVMLVPFILLGVGMDDMS